MEAEPKRVQTVEKHEAIFEAYTTINRELNERDEELAREVSATYRYKKVAEQFHMDYKTIRKIILQKLKQKSRCR